MRAIALRLQWPHEVGESKCLTLDLVRRVVTYIASYLWRGHILTSLS